MLDYKPKHYVKYWKLSFDEEDNEVVELITNDLKHLVLRDQYVYLWKLIDGFRTIKDIIDVFVEIYKQNTPEELKEIVCNSLNEMHEGELIRINWNPFG